MDTSNGIETIYDRALDLLSKGHSKEEVLSKFAEHKDELAPLLALSAALLQMPKNIVPTPLMKRKYAAGIAKNFWLTWLHISKFAGVSMSAMLLASAFAVAGYKTLTSEPGQTLFAVKKSAEKLQMVLAMNQDAKADWQIQIAQKRLDEAKNIFNNPESGVEQKKAALSELADQTSAAVAEVNTAAKNNPKSGKNHPLLNSLDNIARQQKNLLAEIKPDTQIKPAADDAQQALTQNTAKIAEIKQSVAILGSEQSLVELSGDPNSVAVLGQINQVSASQITVEKTVFVINFQTIVRDPLGNGITAGALSPKDKVSVVGVKGPNSVIARQISLIRPDQQSEVKGSETSASSSPESKANPGAVKKTGKAEADKSQNSSSTNDSLQTGPNTAVGSFILENPAPQFVR